VGDLLLAPGTVSLRCIPNCEVASVKINEIILNHLFRYNTKYAIELIAVNRYLTHLVDSYETS